MISHSITAFGPMTNLLLMKQAVIDAYKVKLVFKVKNTLINSQFFRKLECKCLVIFGKVITAAYLLMVKRDQGKLFQSWVNVKTKE